MTQRCDQYENLPELQERLTGAMGQMIREGQWGKVGQLSDLLTKLEKKPGDVRCDDISEFLAESESSDANAMEPEKAPQPEPTSSKIYIYQRSEDAQVLRVLIWNSSNGKWQRGWIKADYVVLPDDLDIEDVPTPPEQ